CGGRRGAGRRWSGRPARRWSAGGRCPTRARRRRPLRRPGRGPGRPRGPRPDAPSIAVPWVACRLPPEALWPRESRRRGGAAGKGAEGPESGRIPTSPAPGPGSGRALRAYTPCPMFDSLSDRFESIFSRMRGRGRLGEKEIDEIAREIRLALLEADVNFKVVKSFISRVKEDATGAELSKSLSPAQQVIKIVHQELINTLGGTTGKLTMNPKPPTVVMLVGLQGSGKTTACGKLARHLKSQGLQPLLVAADLQRPAAVTQLQVLGEQVGVPVYSEPTDPVTVARNARSEAGRLGKNVIVLDTAGRLQIDEALMDELRRMREVVEPDNVLLVVDAMTGQEAVSVAESFAETVGIDGVVLTKLDGDARGGAALS